MNDWLTWHTFLAFVLGVLFSTWAKGLVGSAKSKLGG